MGRSEMRARLSWLQVGTVILVEEYTRVRQPNRQTVSERRLNEIPIRYLLLLDGADMKLMEISHAWNSKDAFEDLIKAIPQWSGQRIATQVKR
jgi:hypothetical protein